MSGEVVKLFSDTGAREMARSVDTLSIPPGPRETLPVLRDLTKRMIDVSTCHVTERDMALMTVSWDELPRVFAHDYGAVMFICAENVNEYVDELKHRGHSNALIEIYRQACCDDQVILINFDQDAKMSIELPTFEW